MVAAVCLDKWRSVVSSQSRDWEALGFTERGCHIMASVVKINPAMETATALTRGK